MKPHTDRLPRPLAPLQVWGLMLLSLIGARALASEDSQPLPGVSIIALDRQASEAGPDEGCLVVLRTGSTAESLTVFYSVDGTAQEGVDYQALPGFVTIPSGFASAFITVNPIDDLESEDREIVRLTVVDPPGGETYIPFWPIRARVAIEDDDTQANNPPRVGIARPRNGAVFIAPESIALVARARDEDGFVRTVEFFDGGTSLGVVTSPRPLSREELIGNPELLEETISRKMAELANVPEKRSESDDASRGFSADSFIQVFHLKWENIEPGEHILTALATDTDGDSTLSRPIVITVKKGPPVPVVNVVAVDPIATEQGGILSGRVDGPIQPSNGTDQTRPERLRPNNAVFVIKRRAADLSQPLHVFYRVLGTAENGADYRRIPHHVAIPAGACAVSVTIRPIDDDLEEGRENVIIRLVPQLSDETFRSIPGYYRVGHHGVARAVIIDNDTPSANLPPNVRLIRPHDGDIYRAGSGITLIAQATDRDGFIRSVEFFEGENSLGIIINPLIGPVDKAPVSLSKSTRLSVRKVPPYRIVWKKVPAGNYLITAVATDNKGERSVSAPAEIKVIAVNPGPVVTIIARDPVAEESARATVATDHTATFVVARRGGIIDRPLTVFYRIGGKAENGVDYRKIPGSVTIKPGEFREKVMIVPIDDEVCEGTESVIIKLTYPVHTDGNSASMALRPYRIGRPDRARAIIRDNDTCPENQSPEVTILLPFDGVVFQAPVDIPIFGLAGDVDGKVVEVALFANATFIGRAVRLGPCFEWTLYGMEWSDAPAGKYKLCAVATDDDGAITRSKPVRIEVLAEGNSMVGTIAGSGTTILSDGAVISVSADAIPSTFSARSVIVDQNGELIELPEDPERDEVLANISSRGLVKTGSKRMIAGFTLSGSGTKQVLIRAVGPTLETFGVPGTLENPRLELYASGSSIPLRANDDWSNPDPAGIRNVSSRLGAFALTEGSTDSVLLLNLPPGGYTAQISGVADGIGVGLVEVYDADDPRSETATAEIINISTRGEIGLSGDVLIAGFVINGSAPRQVLIRGTGPTLAGFGVAGTIDDPRLELFSATEGAQADPISTNDNWEDFDGGAIANAGAILGGFPLDAGSGDAALLIWLEPGAYTARMSGQDGGTGVGLIEVFEMP